MVDGTQWVTILGIVLWGNYVVTILEYGTLVVTIKFSGEVFGGILSVTILL